MARETEFDVIVVGAGGSGLAAAYSAAEHGARVLAIEKRPRPGGTTGIAVGSFTGSGTSLQRDAGIEDAPAAHAEDVARFAEPNIERRNNGPLRAYFLREAAQTLEWLLGLGIRFAGPHPEPPNRVPRMHTAVPGAKAYISVLHGALRGLGGELLCDTQVESLLREDSRVVGVRTRGARGTRKFRAKRGVILAGGDYANNPDIIAQHKGERFRQIEGINPFATGEGHALAQEVGGQLLNMDITYGPELRFVPTRKDPFEQRIPVSGWMTRWIGAIARRLPDWLVQAYVKRSLVTWQHPEHALLEDGAILINADGQRFVDETASPERELAVAIQPDRMAFILLDHRLFTRYSSWPHFISTAPDIAYAYASDYQRLRPDVTTTGTSFDDVAARRGLDRSAVKSAVHTFNQYVAGHHPDPFGRAADEHPLEDGPCLLLGPVKAYFTTTEGGVAVNERLQVLDQCDQIIPGLFAVGQNGLGGMVLWGHGLHIAWAMTSGRLVGRFVMENP